MGIITSSGIYWIKGSTIWVYYQLYRSAGSHFRKRNKWQMHIRNNRSSIQQKFFREMLGHDLAAKFSSTIFPNCEARIWHETFETSMIHRILEWIDYSIYFTDTTTTHNCHVTLSLSFYFISIRPQNNFPFSLGLSHIWLSPCRRVEAVSSSYLMCYLCLVQLPVEKVYALLNLPDLTLRDDDGYTVIHTQLEEYGGGIIYRSTNNTKDGRDRGGDNILKWESLYK